MLSSPSNTLCISLSDSCAGMLSSSHISSDIASVISKRSQTLLLKNSCASAKPADTSHAVVSTGSLVPQLPVFSVITVGTLSSGSSDLVGGEQLILPLSCCLTDVRGRDNVKYLPSFSLVMYSSPAGGTVFRIWLLYMSR